MSEPDITINGYRLTTGQAMTVRVALESFSMALANEGLGEDEHGVTMVRLYQDSIEKIRQFVRKK